MSGCSVPNCNGTGMIEYKHGEQSFMICDPCFGALSPTELREALGITEGAPAADDPPADTEEHVSKKTKKASKAKTPKATKPKAEPKPKPAKAAKAPKPVKEPKPKKADRGPLKTFAIRIPKTESKAFHDAVKAQAAKTGIKRSASAVAEELLARYAAGDKAILAALFENEPVRGTEH